MTKVNTRRLPSWMLKINTADKPNNSAIEVKKSTLSDKVTKTQAVGSKIKPLINKLDKNETQEKEIKQQTEMLKVCETRTKKATNDGDAKKRPKRKKLEDDATLNENITTKKLHVKRRWSKDCDTEAVSQERSDEEVSFTVEDLLSIAEEYVSADKKKQLEEHATMEKSSILNPSSLIISSKAGLGGALLSKCTNTSRNFHLIEKKGKERENDKIENFDSSIISTGDVGQDMLNLYLGPFLNSSPCVKPSDLATESENFSSIQAIESELSGQAIISKRMPSVSEFNKQVNSFAIPKEEVDAPLMKKKSSLKDKVAMFFN